MGLGDILFPDNPKRRDRAAELANDIKAFGTQFDALKNDRDAVAVRLKPKLLKLLDHHGLSDPKELSRRIEAGLDSEEIKKYNDLKKSITSADDIETIILGLIDIVAAVSGVVIGIGFLAGVAGAGAALAAGGEILLVVSAVVFILSALESFEERDKLRESIVELTEKRVHVRITLGQMEAIVHWIKQVEVWMDALDATNHDLLDTLVSETLQKEYRKWTREFAVKDLATMDVARNSYHEDY